MSVINPSFHDKDGKLLPELRDAIDDRIFAIMTARDYVAMRKERFGPDDVRAEVRRREED